MEINLNRTRNLLATLALLAASGGAVGDTAPSVVAAVPAPVAPASSLIGVLDLRPSYLPGVGGGYSENLLEVGYKFNSTYSVSYAQFFNTNIYDPTTGPDEGGVRLTLPGSFIRTRANKVLQSGDFNLGLQNRLYLPLASAERDNGKITSIRQYFSFNQKVSETLSFTASVIPIAHVYSRAVGVKGSANPAFENRVYLITNINLSEKLSFSLPLMFHQTKARSAAGAANSGAWTFFAWANPELGYQINPNVAVGVGYYSDNLIKADLSGWDVRNGLVNGVAQLFATMEL